MALTRDLGPTGTPSDLSVPWTPAVYQTNRSSSRFRVRVSQPSAAAAYSHVYGFGKTGTLSDRGVQEFGTQCWAGGDVDNVEVSIAGFSADQTTTVEITLAPGGQTQTNITSYTIYPKHLNVPASLVSGKLVLQMPADTRIYVEVNGNRKDVLFVFSDPLAIDTVPTTTGTTITVSAGNIGGLNTVQGQDIANPLVIVFPPGIWELPTVVGSSSSPGGATPQQRYADHMLWPVRPFTKIHLQRGAWVVGSFDLRVSNDVAFSGPGVVSGEWATEADIDGTLQGSLLGNFDQQVAWSAFHGRTYVSNEDYSFPNMEVRGLTMVGHPFYTFNLGISLCDRIKVISHWYPNTDGTNGLALNASNNVTLVDKSLFYVGDDGLARSNNFGITLMTNTHCVCFNGAPIFLGYWPYIKTSALNFGLFDNCTVQSCAPANGNFGMDLYTGEQGISWGNIESAWSQNSPYSMPSSFTNSIIKMWMDGNDNDPKDYGFYNVAITNLKVEGQVPMSLFCIGNLFYPFNNGVIEERAGNASNIALTNITVEQTPTVKSRLIGRDKLNTPHDITFSNVTIAGQKVTVRNWDQYVVQHYAPYNILVEGRIVVTAVDICNLALSHIGESATVTSIAPPDGSAQSILCNQFFNRAVEELLEMHAWSFATARADLAETATNDVDGWKYSYAYPPAGTEIVRTLQVLPDGYKDTYIEQMTKMQPAYTIEQASTGSLVLYTDLEDAEVRYVKFVYTPGLYPPLFITSLSWLLASKLAGPIMKGDVGAAEAKRCLQMLQFYLGKAASSDSNQRITDTSHSAPWMSGR
ncbi:MAG: hypothetical protein ACK5S6_02565 [bacterium]